MPSWSEIVSDVNQYSNAGNELDKKREEYLNKIRSITGRNVIAYYSGWLKVPASPLTTLIIKVLQVRHPKRNPFLRPFWVLSFYLR